MSWWQRHAGLRCPPPPAGGGSPLPPLPPMPLAACQRACAADPTCAGVSTDVAVVAWDVAPGRNCYAGHGAVELVDGDGTVDSCFRMALPQCRAQCLLTPRCTGVEWARGSGACCLRADVEPAQCDEGDPDWDLHTVSTRHAVPADARPCRLLNTSTVGQCDTYGETSDTHILHRNTTTTTTTSKPWWRTSHYAERSFMPRHYSCDADTPNATCTLQQLTKLLPGVVAEGYTVVNVDWPVEAGPNSLYEGFGAKDYWRVDPLLGTTQDWLAFVGDAHRRGLKVVADFNPSYFWTGAPAFQRALRDVRQYGVDGPLLPATSPARWFRWNATCPDGVPSQPPSPDAHPRDGITNSWVRAEDAGGACYWSIWGVGQPCGDLDAPEWRAELTAILTHWAVDMGLDGFMLDAPPYYLATPRDVEDPLDGVHDAVLARRIREVVVEPMHALGVAVFGETYNLLRPSYNKMLDAGRNTDMPDGVAGFPSRLHDMVAAGDATGLETLLRETVDVLAGWSGGAVRTEPDLRGTLAVVGQKAAVTALVGMYYVVRMGDPNCRSPLPGYGPYPSGDEWPGGCFGKWRGTDAMVTTLRAIHAHPGLRPGSPRQLLANWTATGGVAKGVFVALRGGGDDDDSGEAVVLLFNFATSPTTVAIQQTPMTPVLAGQTSRDLIAGGRGPQIPASGEDWTVGLPAHGWRALAVKIKTT